MTTKLRRLAAQLLERVRRIQSTRQFYSRVTDISPLSVANPQNVLILTVDCLRNDHLSRSGYTRETTPFLDSLPEYTPAVAAAPWTFSSVPSILTGCYPHNHGAMYSDDTSRNQDFQNPPHTVNDDVYTLGELLGASGYETWFGTAIGVAALPLAGRFETMVRDYNVSATNLLSTAKDWWNTTTKPKFAYIHLGDLHAPLQMPTDTPFGDIPDIDGIRNWRFEESITPREDFEAYRDGRQLLYDTVLREVDRAIKQFLIELDDREDTVVIITSDHGEEFWEYRDLERKRFDDPRGIAGVGHGHALVPPVLEVPVLSDSLPISDEEFASSVDIFPSLLSLLDVSDINKQDGHMLSETSSRPVISQEIAYGPNQISITGKENHLIVIPSRDEKLLLDYETGEVVSNENRMRELQSYLPDRRKVGEQVSISEDMKDHLADLGYR